MTSLEKKFRGVDLQAGCEGSQWDCTSLPVVLHESAHELCQRSTLLCARTFFLAKKESLWGREEASWTVSPEF